jgi:ATP-dependent DNA helicase RecG
LPEPIIEEYGGGLQITFLNKEKVTEKVTKKVTEKVTENQKAILIILKDNPYCTTSKLSNKIGISQRKIKENIRKLKESGILERIGSARGGYWKVLK